MRAARNDNAGGKVNTTEGTDPIDDREIVSTRLFATTPDTIFRAFGDPEHLMRWWGPAGFTNTFHRFEFRPGGRWRFDMHGPDGACYPMEKEFIEVVEPERIVLRHPDATHGFRMTMDFESEEDGTRLTWRMLFDSAAECERVRDVVVRANEENFDRLEEHLARASDLHPL